MLCVDFSRLCMSGLSLCDLCLRYSILGSQFSNKYLLNVKTCERGWKKITHEVQRPQTHEDKME